MAGGRQTNENLSRSGRKAGSKNKITRELKEMVLAALDGAGGVDYLQRQADENPKAFLSLIGRTLPLTVNANHSGGITVQIAKLAS
jgi:hypothetical protein